MEKIEKLQKKIFVKGIIKAETGLHIGGTNSQMGIGGLDNLIIRNPLNQKPIIPGSSLKGKMRALLELTKGKYNIEGKDKDKGKVGNDPEITALFGMSADKKNMETHASRLIVRDAELSNDSISEWDNTDMLYSESKTEVVINRLTSAAIPRSFERVPAGAEFAFEMVVNVVSEDDNIAEKEKQLLQLLAEGMQLLQDDYLGGNGSRGYGKIRFTNLTIIEKDFNHQTEKEPDTEITELFSNFV
jgi:CRISPR-associated protein Csm3